jgi:hypothetical protein
MRNQLVDLYFSQLSGYTMKTNLWIKSNGLSLNQKSQF